MNNLEKLKKEISDLRKEYDIFLEKHTVENENKQDISKENFFGIPYDNFNSGSDFRTIVLNDVDDINKMNELPKKINETIFKYNDEIIRQEKLKIRQEKLKRITDGKI